MKFIIFISVSIFLVGCISGAPVLTQEQYAKLSKIKVYKKGDKIEERYSTIKEISAADCSGPGGTRLYGKNGKAMDILLRKAGSLNADALVNVRCGVAPLVNNCWAAKKCSGEAVNYR